MTPTLLESHVPSDKKGMQHPKNIHAGANKFLNEGHSQVLLEKVVRKYTSLL